jgi:RsiW-degrading membrane proteinase PrsW (M82 family)
MATTPAPPPSAPHIRRPHWGYQTSLWQIGQPSFWLFLVLLLGGGLIIALFQAGFVGMTPLGWVLSWLLLLIYAVPVFIFIYVLDLYEREPVSLIISALLWGALAATTMSIFGNQGWALVVFDLLDFDTASRWVAALTAPFVEEVTKGMGVILIYLIARREVDDVMDGFVYGALVGLGFTIIEDVFYFVNQFGGTFEGVLQGFYVRVVASGLYGHVLYSGLFGIGVAYFVSRRQEASFGKRFWVAAALIVAAMFAHFLWNSPLLDFYPQQLESPVDYLQVIAATAVKGIPFLLFLVLMIALARRREHRWLRAALATEVGREGIQEPELATLENPSARRRARRELARQYGPTVGHTVKRLQRAQINLAMVATRVHQDDHPDLIRQRQYCKALRDWILAYTGAARPAPPAGGPYPA